MEQFFWEKRLGGTPKQEIYTVEADGYAILPDGMVVVVSRGKARPLTIYEIKEIADGKGILRVAERFASQG